MSAPPDRRPTRSFALLGAALAAACHGAIALPPLVTDSIDGGGGDHDLAAGPTDLSSPLPPTDLAGPRDLAAPVDLAAPADLATPCHGARPPADAWKASPGPWRFPQDGGLGVDGMFGGGNSAGSPAPSWRLRDFQPQSCGFGATYGLDVFKGRPLVVALWAGW